MKVQNINHIIERVYPLLEADAFSQNKQLLFQPRETTDVLLDSQEITQLILNLCRNGLEAMQDHGALFIRTYSREDHVELSIEDERQGLNSNR